MEATEQREINGEEPGVRGQTGGVASKIIAVTFLMFILVTIAIVLISYQMYKEAFYDYGNSLCLSSNAQAAYAINGDEVRHFAETLTADERYERFAARLDELSGKINAKYFYILVDNGVPGMYTYIYDATHSQEFPGEKYALGRNETKGEYDGAAEVLATGQGFEKALYYNEAYGELYYAYAPIFDSGGQVAAFLGTDVDITPLHRQVAKYRLIILGVMALALMLFAGVYFKVIGRLLTKPLLLVSQRAKRLAKGDFNLEISGQMLARRDEIGRLARAFESVGQSVGGLGRDIEHIMKAAREGRMDERADASAYQGAYCRIISGVNDTMDTTTRHFDVMPEAVAFFDPSQALLFRNRAMTDFLRLHRWNENDGPAVLERLLAAQDRPPRRGELASLFAMECLEPVALDIHLSPPESGETRHYSAILLHAGSPSCALPRQDLERVEDDQTCIMLVLSDMTPLVHAKNDAMAASRAKSDFLSRMSHEIRTPMNAIIGLTQIASDSGDLDKIHSFLNQIEKSSNHLLGIINDILDFSKIEAGKMALEAREFSLIQNTDFVVSMMKSRAREKKLTIVSAIGNIAHSYVTADSLRLNQVLINILSNAVKFSPESGRIDLGLEEISHADGHSLFRFTVRDQGIGIEPSHLARLFQPFEQADSSVSRSYGGTGLGLVIAKSLVEAMGGQIEAESEPGRGSLFAFTIDVPAHSAPTAEVKAGVEKQAPRRDFTGQRALIVDDIDLNRKILAQLLHRTGLATEEAENGREALEKFQASPNGYYDYVLMDMQMPVMDGCESTAAIRALNRPDAAAVRIIAMTANVMREDIDRALAAGMNAHTGKPVNMKELLESMSPSA